MSTTKTPRRHSRAMRRAVAALTLFLGTSGALVGFAGVASAHNGALSGTSTCASNGTYTVDWTLVTSNVPIGDTAAVSLVSDSPVSTVAGVVQSILNNTTGSPITQTDIAGTSTEADLSVHLHWTGMDTYDGDASGVVALAGTCKVVVVTPPTTTTTTTTTTTPPTTTPVPPSSPVSTPPTTVPTTTTVPPTTQIGASTTPAVATTTTTQLAPAPSTVPCSYTSETAPECTTPPVVNGVPQGDG